MTKKDIRQAVWKKLTEMPKKWTQVVDRAIWLGMSTWITVTAFANYQVGALLLIIGMLVVGLLVLYFTAKGR